MSRLLDMSIVRKAWSIAWPLIISEAVNSILWLTDTFFVSRLGDEAIAAVGLGGYVSWVLFVFNSIYYMGVLVLASQAYGAGNYERASKILGESLTASFLLAIPLVLFGEIIDEPLIRLLGGRGAVLSLGVIYLDVRLLGLLASAPFMTLSAAYRAVEKTKPVMAAAIIGSASNVILDPILIFGLWGAPKLGIAGAAWASVAAMIVNLGLLALMASSAIPFPTHPRIPGREAVEAAKVGIPAMAERGIFASGNMFYIGSVARCSDMALAAHTIGVRLESLAFLPASAISTAASVLSGQEMGRGDLEASRRAGWEVAKAAGILMSIVGILLMATAPLTPAVFTSTPGVRRLAGLYLVLAGVSEAPSGLSESLAATIRGAGNTVVPTIINALSLYLFRVTPAYILPRHMPGSLCPLGAWLSMDLDIGARSLIFLYVFRRMFHRLARKLV